MIWLHGEKELNQFLARLNSFRKSIKFTWEFSTEGISFLDVKVIKVNGAFQTDVFSKPTDAHQYLNFKSCHAPHIRKGIPYSQALRLKRICSDENNLKIRLQELKGYLVKRGYNPGFVESQFSGVKEISRTSLFTRKESSETKSRNCFVVDYHPALSALYGIFRELQQIVGLSDSFLSVMPEPPMISFRRCKNLKDHLVRSKLSKEKDRIDAVGGMFKCGSKKCKVCENVLVGSYFESHVEGRKFHINHRFDCNSEGVVYLVTCKACKMQCVGCTITSFRLRFNNHKSSLNRYGQGIRNINGQHLYGHFFGEGHLGLIDFRVQIIDSTDVINPTERESYWIEKINCYCPLRLNMREESNY